MSLNEEQREVVQVMLRDLPLHEKLTHLVFSLLVDDAALSVENLVEIALVMSRRLPPLQRAAVIWQLRDACAELEATWQ